MKLPRLPGGRGKTRRQLLRFGGLNYGDAAVEGELVDSRGLSSARYPCLTQRGGRAVQGTYKVPTDIYARGKLCVVDGGTLYYGGEPVGTLSDGRKQFAVVNTKLCVFPDKKYLDLTTKEFKSLDASMSSAAGIPVTFTEHTLQLQSDEVVETLESRFLDSYDGKSGPHGNIRSSYDNYTMQYDSVEWNRSAGTWTLTGGAEVLLRNLMVGKFVMLKRSDIQGSHVLNTREVLTENGVVVNDPAYAANDNRGFYARIENREVRMGDLGYPSTMTHLVILSYAVHDATNANGRFTSQFEPGDRVDISGCAATGNNREKAAVTKVEDYTLTFAEGTFTAGTETGVITVARPVPDLDFICESDNRLWGVHGVDIYASALGDPRNFYAYGGLSTDSYAVAVGTDGPFTGCVGYSEGVLLWKEDCLHKLLGTQPSNYELYTYRIPGVQPGSERSLQVIDETLYYKGVHGVYAYTGGQPRLISYCFGRRRFTGAVGGSDGTRYYLSMYDEAGAPGLYVYDTLHGLWLKEDDTEVKAFATLGGTLHLLSGSTVYQAERPDAGEGPVEWLAELAPFTESDLGRKAYGRLLLRLDLEAGAWVRVEARRDAGPWRVVWTGHNSRASTACVPILPARCGQLSVRLSGRGGCTLRGLAREFRLGSALG